LIEGGGGLARAPAGLQDPTMVGVETVTNEAQLPAMSGEGQAQANPTLLGRLSLPGSKYRIAPGALAGQRIETEGRGAPDRGPRIAERPQEELPRRGVAEGQPPKRDGLPAFRADPAGQPKAAAQGSAAGTIRVAQQAFNRRHGKATPQRGGADRRTSRPR